MDFVVGLPETIRRFNAIWSSWEPKLPIVDFTYNNSYQLSITLAPYKPLYGRKYRSPIHWNEDGEKVEFGQDLIKQTLELLVKIRNKMKTVQTRQKSYADKRRREKEFTLGDHVFVKVASMKGVMRFGKKCELSSMFIRPFEVLKKIGTLAYRVA
ncbi:uncharacterized protein [Primulina huaijiensis]|uniref:uncharacterized protein n=1 Tax=Primulina huaijiensis TaxID=1492673 RepID=UPI003CC70075